MIFFSLTGNCCAFILITITPMPIKKATTMEKTKYNTTTPSFIFYKYHKRYYNIPSIVIHHFVLNYSAAKQ
ncbi:hypothetical protein SAR03_01470 [Staphylococcus arlettae]|uniref:Secreted protein n=1 Tax=Staphylococcus arlettae TaxID=29378 RepID=A0ABQ0XQE5_9STAP|nr:hypothetical protein SAR03_01470 [Staphylococcus arlettae]